MSKDANQFQVQVEAELTDLFSAIRDITQEAVIGIDKNQNIILFSQRAERIFGYAAAEVMGKAIDILLPHSVSDTHRAHVRYFAESDVKSLGRSPKNTVKWSRHETMRKSGI